MSEMKSNRPSKGKGDAFFNQGDQVASTGNWDYAIEMYCEGLKRDPGNIERGHQKMRDMGLSRTAQGGKPAGFRDKRGHKLGSKDPAENLANASFLWAKDPGSDMCMEQALKAAHASELPEVVRWVTETMLRSQADVPKPSKRLCVVMMEIAEKYEHFDQAVKACQLALVATPDDPKLDQKHGQLGALYTLKKGKYGEDEKDFTDSVANLEEQKRLLQQDSAVQSDEFLEKEIRRAKHEYDESPTVPGKINSYADALLKFEDDAHENQALEMLDGAYQKLGAYQFKLRQGDIRIRQYKRRVRELVEAGDREAAKALAREQLVFEVKEYQDRAKNYPTDMGIRYELGKRLYVGGKYDEAIGALQQAQRDPRRAVSATNLLGQAFMKKQWWREAVDTFTRVLRVDMPDDRTIDIRYNLGDCYEQLDELVEAEEQFSHVAQIDFNHKDVRDRLEAVRVKMRDQK